MANNNVNRFQPLNVDNFIEENENANTLRKTASNLKLLGEFLNSCGESRCMNTIPPFELDPLLAQFIVSVRTNKGTEYEPSTLRGMISSFDRHLRKRNYGFSIINGTGTEFAKTRDALRAKQRDLKSQGKGSKPQRAEPITDKEIEQLYAAGELGNANPNSVLNTFWFLNTLHFGMRGGATEHRAMCWGDIVLKHDDSLNLDYLEYHERATKTRTGDDIKYVRPCPPRMYATPDNPSRCPVALYMLYSSKRPETFSNQDDPFYLAAVTNNKNPDLREKWFLKAPVGKNKLDNIMKNMAQKGGLPERRITNTSVRKALVQKMTDHNVPDNLQVYVTGHKNPQSLNNYRTLNDTHKYQISRILSETQPQVRHNLCLPPTTSNDQCRPAAPCDKSALPPVPTKENTDIDLPFPHSNPQHAMNMMKSNTSSSNRLESVFAGSSLNNCSININITNNLPMQNPKRRRIIYDSDSD